MVENFIISKSSFVFDKNLTFVGLILSLIFPNKVTAICLKFLSIFSQYRTSRK